MGLFGGKRGSDKSSPEPGLDSPPLDLVNLAPPPPQERKMQKPRYGIEQAIALMRTLPVNQNVELVVHVIKATLESLDVKLLEIIEDAASKQHTLEKQITL